MAMAVIPSPDEKGGRREERYECRGKCQVVSRIAMQQIFWMRRKVGDELQVARFSTADCANIEFKCPERWEAPSKGCPLPPHRTKKVCA